MNLIAKWRADHWELAAAMLEHFVNNKNGTKAEFDVSNFSSHIKNDPQMGKWLNNFFVWEARENTSFWSASKSTIKLQNEKVGHRRWIMGDGEPFYAFGGMDLYVTGTLKICKEWSFSSERAWTFTGTVTIRDTYTFPDIWYRMWFPDYAAANYLETHGYRSFGVIMAWLSATSGNEMYQ